MDKNNVFENNQFDFDNVFESDEELSKVAKKQDQLTQETPVKIVDVNEVVENIILLDEMQEQRKKQRSSIVSDDEVNEVTPHQIGLIAGLLIVVFILVTVIFIVPRFSTAFIVSQATEIQAQLASSMQTTRSVQNSGTDFQINFDYDDTNLISKLVISEFNGDTKTVYSSAQGDQFDSVLALDVNASYSEVAYVSVNSEKASSYTVTYGAETTEYSLDTTMGFVVIAPRTAQVKFYNFVGAEVYA